MPTALIVGASRGLGRALVEEHLKRGWQVVATVRDPAALDDIRSDTLTVEAVDTTDWAGIDALRDRLAGRTLDLLFVSAAIFGPSARPDRRSGLGADRHGRRAGDAHHRPEHTQPHRHAGSAQGLGRARFRQLQERGTSLVSTVAASPTI